ncbi:MAG: dUTP diphosphatase [Nitrospinota bacterium]|nr:dUTP diphosphatase [Nitrospinota bacterium]
MSSMHSKKKFKVISSSQALNIPSPQSPGSVNPKVCRVQGKLVPSYAHPDDAGADLRSAVVKVIPARGKELIPTGIRISLPPGHVGLIWPRSGLAVHRGLDCGAGVVDSEYRGEIKVLIFNHSNEDHLVQQGDRIAQLLVQKIEKVEFIKVDNLDDTPRGRQGFGSTGV